MTNLTLIRYAVRGLAVALVYQIATNPFAWAGIMVLATGIAGLLGHWLPGLLVMAIVILVVWAVLNAVAVLFGKWRVSRLTGDLIYTAPDWLFVLGNEQEGYDSEFAKSLHPTWPKFARRFVWAAWRNKARNLPFLNGLQRWHFPKGPLEVIEKRAGGVLYRVRKSGQMIEVEYIGTKYFGDFGPRLDQPEEWGNVSWAFRPRGRL